MNLETGKYSTQDILYIYKYISAALPYLWDIQVK